jgi:hypothetical protein
MKTRTKPQQALAIPQPAKKLTSEQAKYIYEAIRNACGCTAGDISNFYEGLNGGGPGDQRTRLENCRRDALGLAAMAELALEKLDELEAQEE